MQTGKFKFLNDIDLRSVNNLKKKMRKNIFKDIEKIFEQNSLKWFVQKESKQVSWKKPFHPNTHKNNALREFFFPITNVAYYFGYITPSKILALNSTWDDLDKMNFNLVGWLQNRRHCHSQPKSLFVAPDDESLKV